MEKISIEEVKKEVSVLTADEQQVLKDAIRYGEWGDGEYDFLVARGVVGNGWQETDSMTGFCTNDAKQAGHFEGRKISAMFRSIYKKMCPEHGNQIGYVLSHCRDWWGDGSGDMLFIRDGWDTAFIEWARQ
jgi:hypothetical protein